MARDARGAPGGLLYHVLKRAAGGLSLFHKPAGYRAFQRVMVEPYQRAPCACSAAA